MTEPGKETATPEGPPRVRRVNPGLEAEPDKEPKDSPGRSGFRRLAGLFLYAAMGTVLFLPWVRRQRRRPAWNRARRLIGLTGAGCAALGWALASNWLIAPAALMLAFALFAGAAKNPDRERILQARLGARSFLQGGVLESGRIPGGGPLAPGSALYLLLRDSDLLLVPREAGDEVPAVIDLRLIAKVLVDGEPYRPVFVPQAKDPPARGEKVDRARSSRLALVFSDGASVSFVYRGAFSRHLAESTAHALHQACRSANGVSGQSPEVFHIVGR